jgi:hypothetical protein
MIENFLRVVEDCQWHCYEEIEKATNFTILEMMRIIKFLEKYSIINIDKDNKKIKADPSFFELSMNL